eukprot:9431648-Karenia_brevis.AAC.1
MFRSTTESEIISLAASSFSEAIPMIDLWEKLLGRKVPLVIDQDNQATLVVAKARYSPELRHVQRTHKLRIGSIKDPLAQE